MAIAMITMRKSEMQCSFCGICCGLQNIFIIQLVRLHFFCRAKLYNRKRYAEKVEMKKKIKMHEKRETKNKKEDVVPDGAVPAYLLDRFVYSFLFLTLGVSLSLLLCVGKVSPEQRS